MEDSSRDRRALGIGSLLPLLLIIYIPYQLLTYPKVGSIEWYSVISEGTVTLFVLFALILTEKMNRERQLYMPFLLGFTALLYSGVTDVLDEFIAQPEWVTVLLEDMLQLIGFPLVVFGLFRWSTMNAKLQTELQYQAVTDYLTGALNRRGFMDQFEQEVVRSKRYGSPLSLIWFDLDQFKMVNDRYGHQTGDEVLRLTSKQTKDHIRVVDTLGRMGGEEFCIMMPETRLDGAAEVAEKLRTAFESCECSGDIQITASFGVAEYRPGENPDTLLKRVDDALYRAKHNGRNRIVREL